MGRDGSAAKTRVSPPERHYNSASLISFRFKPFQQEKQEGRKKMEACLLLSPVLQRLKCKGNFFHLSCSGISQTKGKKEARRMGASREGTHLIGCRGWQYL